MLINNMMNAWQKRQPQLGADAVMPAQPAGAAALDEVYLDAIVGGAGDSLDVFSLGCSSSVPPTVAGCSSTTSCTA